MTKTLITRLSKLDAPDREVDAEIAMKLLGYTRINRMKRWPDTPPIWDYFKGEPFNSDGVLIRPYTASVDAAIALAKRVFGKVGYSVAETEDDEEAPFAFIHINGEAYLGEGATPAIALLIALLRAKEASNGIR